RRADVAEREAIKEDLHVGEAADRDADPPDLAGRLLRVGVVTHLRRQVEGDGQPRLALLEEVPEPAVRLLGRREPGVLAHRPEPAPVHRRLDATREGRLAGDPKIGLRVEAERLEVLGRVEVADLDVGAGREALAALWRGLERSGARRRPPALHAVAARGPARGVLLAVAHPSTARRSPFSIVSPSPTATRS